MEQRIKQNQIGGYPPQYTSIIDNDPIYPASWFVTAQEQQPRQTNRQAMQCIVNAAFWKILDASISHKFVRHSSKAIALGSRLSPNKTRWMLPLHRRLRHENPLLRRPTRSVFCSTL
jgi:hypothetical protein